MSYQEITLEVKDYIATLTLNRPRQLNALTTNLLTRELPQAIAEIHGNEQARVVILTGAGRVFCAGADMELLNQLSDREAGPAHRQIIMDAAAVVVKGLQGLGKPSIAAINGLAVGAGFSLVMACDFKIATQRAKFASLFIKRGLIADCGLTYTLPRAAGLSKALEIMLLGEPIETAEAERIGLVNRVVTSEELMPVALELAGKLAKLPPIALRLHKEAAYRSLTSDLACQLEFETQSQLTCFRSDDFREGIKSFLEKREPEFKGK
jgi:2-(1,2-epoxy-1,2-dihydrophenyl)acetyl-CoA isomerase